MTSTAYNQKKPPKRVFFAAVIMIFFSTFSAADSIGFVPNYIDGTTLPSTVDTLPLADLPQLGENLFSINVAAESVSVLPEHIKIPAIDLDLPIQNPSTRNIDALDALLQSGPARYVDSALLGSSGNMIIFAHSSHLPVVRNQMFRAFNKIPELKAGDTITLQGDGKDYVYSVTSVRKADARPAASGSSDAIIDLSTTQGTKLTLVTCDTLTSKSARYILEADFVGIL